MNKYLGFTALIGGLAGLGSAALATSALAPFGPPAAGGSVNYRVYGSTSSPEGEKPFDSTVSVNKAPDGSLNVLSGTTALGSVSAADVVTEKSKSGPSLFNPFKHLAELFANRPADINAGATWKATAVIPFGSRTFSVPLDVTAAIEGDSVKLTAHGTSTDSAEGAYGPTDFSVTVDESAQYAGGQFSGSTFTVQTNTKTELKRGQGATEATYSTRYYVAPAS